MDPSTGGFLSRDPAAGFQTDPRSMHDYLYAYGDPVNLTDPTGLNPTLTEISISFAIAASISAIGVGVRSEEHTSELQSLMRISYAVFCLKKKHNQHETTRDE